LLKGYFNDLYYIEMKFLKKVVKKVKDLKLKLEEKRKKSME
jgi:hypothetical protein